jgi:hypothetical protein
MSSRKKINAAKNKALKKELYDILSHQYRDKAGDGDREWNGKRTDFSVGPYRAHIDYGSGSFNVDIDGKCFSVVYSSQSGKYHWLGTIPNDRDLMKLRLYV